MVPPFVRQFIAGSTVPEVVSYAEELYEDDGVHPIVNVLGEHYEEKMAVEDDVDLYLDVMDALGDSSVPDPAVSVKPTQLGLEQSPAVFKDSLETLVSNRNGCFVWVDMESYVTFHDTVDVVKRVAQNHPGVVGLCLQSNIRETSNMIREVADLDMKIRLVKGAYSEGKEVAYQERDVINGTYKDCIETAFVEFNGTPTGFAVGTHHDEMISFARGLQEEFELDSFEVQMLMGVRERRQRELVEDGVVVYQYIPFGEDWLSYFYRRVRENKRNLFFALRAIVSR